MKLCILWALCITEVLLSSKHSHVFTWFGALLQSISPVSVCLLLDVFSGFRCNIFSRFFFFCYARLHERCPANLIHFQDIFASLDSWSMWCAAWAGPWLFTACQIQPAVPGLGLRKTPISSLVLLLISQVSQCKSRRLRASSPSDSDAACKFLHSVQNV